MRAVFVFVLAFGSGCEQALSISDYDTSCVDSGCVLVRGTVCGSSCVVFAISEASRDEFSEDVDNASGGCWDGLLRGQCLTDFDAICIDQECTFVDEEGNEIGPVAQAAPDGSPRPVDD